MNNSIDIEHVKRVVGLASEKKQLPVGKMALVSGVSFRTARKLMDGEILSMRLSVLKQLCDTLDIQLCELFKPTDDQPTDDQPTKPESADLSAILKKFNVSV